MLISLYCLYQSHTRTAFIGFVVFWAGFLYGVNKKYFRFFILIILILSVFFSSQLTNIFLKKEYDPDINVATSGRIDLWDRYFDEFLLFL